MGSHRIVMILSAVAALLAGATLIRQISTEHLLLRSVLCARQLDDCNRACETTFNQTVSRINLDRSLEELDHRQHLIDCNLNVTNAAQCRQNEIARHDQAVAGFDSRERAANDARTSCEQACHTAAETCDRGESQSAPPHLGGGGAVQIECIDTPGFPCYQKVDEICKRLGNVCDQCKLNLCGDGGWTFGADGLQETALVVMSGGKEARTLASTKGGALTIPRDIKLGAGEELNVRFQFAPDAKGRTITVERK